MSSGDDLRHRLSTRVDGARIDLTPPEIEQILTYYGLLSRWNRTINLTALRLDPPSNDTLDRLLIEPLSAAAFIPESPGRWIDLGSGGGSPAIPLKIVRPQLKLTMVEARERKAAFLREAARGLALTDVEVLNERFATLRSRLDLAGRYTLVTVRAVKVDLGLLNLARWLLAPGCRLFLFGAQDSSEAEKAQFEAPELVNLGAEHSSSLLILTAGV